MNLRLVSILVFSLLLVAALSSTAAAQRANNPLELVTDGVLTVFTLDFLDDDEDKTVALIRFLLWLAIFSIIFNATRKYMHGSKSFFTSGSQITIAAVAATSTIVFIPAETLVETMEGFALLSTALLIGALGFVIWWVTYRVIKGSGMGGPAIHGIRAVWLAIAIWILWNLQGDLLFAVMLLPRRLPWRR